MKRASSSRYLLLFFIVLLLKNNSQATREEMPLAPFAPFAGPLGPGVLSLWTGMQCLALVPGGGGAQGSACHTGAGLMLTSADGNAIVDSWTCGRILNKTDLADAPMIRYSLTELDRAYTLIAVDPDKPGLRFGEFQLLLLQSNIPEKELYTGKVMSADMLAEWSAPMPAEGSGLHRVQLYAFEQTAAKVNLTAPADRNIFHLNNWLHMPENMGHLCGPIAGLQTHVGP